MGAHAKFIVEAAFNTPAITSTGATSWTDLSTRLVGFDISRGRSDQLNEFEPGNVNVVLSNHDGALNPSNTNSPYYPFITPRVPIRVRAVDTIDSTRAGSSAATFTIFAGHTESWQDEFRANNLAYTNVSGYDALGLLQQYNLSGSYAKQRTSSRAAEVMINIGMSIGGGYPTFSVNGNSSISSGTLTNATILSHLRGVSQAEGGELFASRENKVLMYSRSWMAALDYFYLCFSNVAGSTFGDGALQTTYTVTYQSMTMASLDSDIRNNISISLNDSTGTSTASDTVSIAAYGERSYSLSGALHESTNTALAQAEWLLARNKNPSHRIRDIALIPEANYAAPASLLDYTGMKALWQMDLTERVRVVHQYPGSTTRIDDEVTVQRIGHTFNARTGQYRMTVGVAPAEWESQWVLDSSRYSVLNTTTKLTY